MLRLTDRAEIHDALCRYARGVDRGDWNLVRSVYHADAYDDHGGYRGHVDGLIEWLRDRFEGVDNSSHFLGNCLIEFAGDDRALVETYFVSSRLRAPEDDERQAVGPRDLICRQAWGRYVDRFERRQESWRIVHRVVVLESVFSFPALGGVRGAVGTWGSRAPDDAVYQPWVPGSAPPRIG